MWGLGVFNGEPCDVGGEGHRYLERYDNQLKVKYIDMVSVQRDHHLVTNILLLMVSLRWDSMVVHLCM